VLAENDLLLRNNTWLMFDVDIKELAMNKIEDTILRYSLFNQQLEFFEIDIKALKMLK